MSDKVDLVRVLTSATGNSTPVTLGARYSDLFMTPADAGAVDGRTYTWLYVDGNNWELVKGVYNASGPSAARTTVLASRNAGTLGTSRITLSGTAQVRIVAAAEDMDGVRGTRAVAGTSDALASTDLGYVVTYSNAAAVAVSLAQAGTASLYDGWATWVQNLGVGTVTITPATSTINGNATLPLATNMGAFIWSDGTNYHAYFVPVSKPLLAGNNLEDVGSATASRLNLGINQMTALASSQDFNLVIAPGTYYSVDATPTNAPTIDYYYLEVEAFNVTGYVLQRAVGINTGVSWVRTEVGGTWSAWQRIFSTAAVKADQVTPTSNVLAVTPLHQQDHDSAAKAWAIFHWSGSAIVLDSAYNVSSITRPSAGRYVVNFTTAFANASYMCQITTEITGNTTEGVLPFVSAGVPRTASSVEIHFFNQPMTASVDPAVAHFVAFGRQ